MVAMFVEKVKTRFQDDTLRKTIFLECIHAHRIKHLTALTLEAKLKDLFDDHPDLMADFLKLLATNTELDSLLRYAIPSCFTLNIFRGLHANL